MRYIMLAGAVALSVFSAGCATKKYVAQTVAPVETHVANVESKKIGTSAVGFTSTRCVPHLWTAAIAVASG